MIDAHVEAIAAKIKWHTKRKAKLDLSSLSTLNGQEIDLIIGALKANTEIDDVFIKDGGYFKQKDFKKFFTALLEGIPFKILGLNLSDASFGTAISLLQDEKTHLEELDLSVRSSPNYYSTHTIRADNFDKFVEFLKVSELSVLNLKYMNIDQDDIKRIADALKGKESLNCLDLSHLGFDNDVDMECILELVKQSKNLRFIDLSSWRIGNEDIEALTKLMESRKTPIIIQIDEYIEETGVRKLFWEAQFKNYFKSMKLLEEKLVELDSNQSQTNIEIIKHLVDPSVYRLPCGEELPTLPDIRVPEQLDKQTFIEDFRSIIKKIEEKIKAIQDKNAEALVERSDAEEAETQEDDKQDDSGDDSPGSGSSKEPGGENDSALEIEKQNISEEESEGYFASKEIQELELFINNSSEVQQEESEEEQYKKEIELELGKLAAVDLNLNIYNEIEGSPEGFLTSKHEGALELIGGFAMSYISA